MPVVGMTLLGLCALVVARWSFSVETTPTVAMPPTQQASSSRPPLRPLALSSPSSQLQQRPRERPRGGREGKARKGGKAKSPRGSAEATGVAQEPARDPLEPDELAWARREYREERVLDMNDRLDGFATEVGWDEETTEDVRALLLDSMDKITKQLSRVDRGLVEWDEVKSDLRDFREDRARKLERYLGPDEFDGFVDRMGFERFAGEEPIRGRLGGAPRRKGRERQR